MEQVKINRQQLYNLVWSEPLSAIIKKYCISKADLHKMFQNMNIPLPENGYWTKLHFGKQIERLELPSEYSGENEVVLRIRDENCTETGNFLSAQKALIKEFEKDPDLPLKVPAKLTNPDKIIFAAKESLESREQGYHFYKGVVATAYDKITIRVSPKNFGRALRFMDTLIKLLYARNHVIKVERGKTLIIIEDQEFEIGLKEKLKIVPPIKESHSRELHATGILSFRIERYYGRTWTDGKEKIESQLASILAFLELKAKYRKEERLMWKEEQKIWEEEEQVKREVEERKEKELSDFKNLLKLSKRWHRAKILKEYLTAIEANLVEEGELSKDSKNEIEWAKRKADWYDPLVAREDEILGYYN